MFKKILIANRGEIACRISKTCRRMGIATVAVYSEADAETLHVAMADEAVLIGPPAPGESYLVIERVVEAARRSGADAIHPGFGFLSENASFVAAVEQAGIVFIGPPAGAVAAMGDKIESKKLAEKAGVNVIPGHMGTIADAEEAVRIAEAIGYPVMIKAAAGGGGKGMRVAHGARDMKEEFRAARSEAKSSFGDDRVFLEKFIVDPRHIEIQVLADGKGNIVYLGERECSIQRRHQKVVEEAPSPLLDAKTRKAMGEQAVALARAVDYRSAGTVEFVADAKKNFYFLEMNTRLQVEHPVTEMVTGLDLVEQMIRIAAGEKLGFGQKDVKLDGWAVEARIYAEDPLRGFLPSIGRLYRYRPPAETDGIRIDSGVEEGSEVTMFYDPMIAKLVCHGDDRAGAIAGMRRALDGFYIRGLNHNVGFLAAIMREERFGKGTVTTNFIAEQWPDGFHGAALDRETSETLAGVGLLAHLTVLGRDRRISGLFDGGAGLPENWVVRLGAERITCEARPIPGGLDTTIDGKAVEVRGDWRPGGHVFDGTVAGRPVIVQTDRSGTQWDLAHAGVALRATILSAHADTLLARMPVKAPPDMSRLLLSPMPGMVVEILVGEGDDVKAGAPLAIVDAMKMENVLRAGVDGRVAKIAVAKGDSLAVDQVILEFET